LVEAFRAANQALELTAGRSAKAWFRRGCAFARMRDPRNAFRDFEEALVRSPGDKAITKQRDEHFDAAESYAEQLFYSRRKELDAQAKLFGLETRHALVLHSCEDVFVDEQHKFSVAQPLARLIEGSLQDIDGKPEFIPRDESAPDSPYFHVHALWTWENLIQRAPQLQYLCVQDVDLGSGALEFLSKGLRSHGEVKVLKFEGVHIGATGAKMLRNVLAQSVSLIEVSLNNCGLHDAGLAELTEGLRENGGALELLSLRRNYFSHKKLEKIADVLCGEDCGQGLTQLDLSENVFGLAGAKVLSRIIGSSRLHAISLQNTGMDFACFWRLVSSLNDLCPLMKLDLRSNPIGRGTRRVWTSTMGSTFRCDVMLSKRPLKSRNEMSISISESLRCYPHPCQWV